MPVSPGEVTTRARRLYDKSARHWVVSSTDVVRLELPLHPPTESESLNDLDGARGWVESWRHAERELPVVVTWEDRNWSRVGRQSLPVRVLIEGADSIAAVAGKRREWSAWLSRISSLRSVIADALAARESRAPESGAPVLASDLDSRMEHVDAVLRTHARGIAKLEPSDSVMLQSAVAWLIQNPVSGMRVRQVPVRGIHTKWLERHRAVVEAIIASATGSDGLGLLEQEPLRRVAFLDPRMRPGGMREMAATIPELAKLDLEKYLRKVLVVENLETLLSLDDTVGVVAIHGGGYSVHVTASIPWVRNRPVLYWGDLDSHGFAILNRIRAHGIDATSVLMDRVTLEEHRELWGSEPKPFRGELPQLTNDERAVFDLLRDSGDVRLEQERIGWQYAWAQLTSVILHR